MPCVSTGEETKRNNRVSMCYCLPSHLCRQTPNLSEPAASPKTDLYPKQSSSTSREGLVSPGFVLVSWVWGIHLVFAVLLCEGFDVCGSAQARSHTLNNTRRSYTSAEGCQRAVEQLWWLRYSTVNVAATVRWLKSIFTSRWQIANRIK